jgi:hypothetical protein
MCDKLVFDLSQEIEGSPSVFIRKDWINMLDNQNQNYNSNQSILDTSQICNSNKYMSYREAYLSIPFLITLGTTAYTPTAIPANFVTSGFLPAQTEDSADYCLGLKNWFGQIIHSFTLDYNGTTIIQQTPYVQMWNSFRLLTSMSLDDINVQGPTIGFFPDDALSWQYVTPVAGACSPSGIGTCNNTNLNSITQVSGRFNNFRSGGGNEGFITRQQLINYDVAGVCNITPPITGLYQAGAQTTYGQLSQGGTTALTNLWKSYIINKIDQTTNALNTAQAIPGVFQINIVATVYLKHIHSFFNFCPLIKGAFMKMTLNLNNTTTEFTTIATNSGAIANSSLVPAQINVTAIQNPLGGVNPIMIASGSFAATQTVAAVPNPITGVPNPLASNGGVSLFSGGFSGATAYAGGVGTTTANISYRCNLSVGAICLDQQLTNLAGVGQGALSRSIYLYIPSYTFNPPFEQAYLSNPVKNIKYTDIYQYQVQNIIGATPFSNLITNGIANIKSVLVLPFFSATNNTILPVANVGLTTSLQAYSANTGFLQGVPVWQSPFDPAGTGPTSPLTWLTNFNIQISGQNAIYNTQKYNFEQYNNQLYGQNAVNGGMTDGINSGLISRQAFDMNYCYYYVNVERMLPAEQSVPKSVQIIGQNQSSKAIDLMVFVEFGVDTINIDILTGARV